MTGPLNVLALEPWHGGSHRDFLTGLVRHSRHAITPLTLPGRFWKWRQTGSGLVLGRKVLENPPPCDLIFASDFLHLPDFLALTRRIYAGVPAVLYFHENQLVYPNQAEHTLDRAYGLANLSGAAVADRVLFNSPYHMSAFFDALEGFIRASPDHPPKGLLEAIQKKSAVVPLGVDIAGLSHAADARRDGPLTILWNHRWEHDKNPEGFFRSLFKLADTGADFRLIVCGQAFSRYPAIFDLARKRLGERILHWGTVPERDDYRTWLARADLVISLAHHDFFGVSVVEAMGAGVLPLLADRLNYPHLLPPEAADLLVADEAELLARLITLCANPEAARARDPRPWVQRFDWPQAIHAFDDCFTTWH